MVLLTSPLVLTAPQYGGNSFQSGSQSAPAHSQSQSVQCRTENQVVWDTKYVETETQNCITVTVPKCSTQYRNQCSPVTKQECQTVYRDQCNTQYEQKCSTQYREEVEYYTETECNTDYKEDCEYQWEGTGNNKVWAPIPGSCRNNAYDKCGDVQKQKLRQVPYDDCQSVPKKVCNKVPEKQCRQVTSQDCRKVPYQDCQDVPQQQCNPVLRGSAELSPRKFVTEPEVPAVASEGTSTPGAGTFLAPGRTRGTPRSSPRSRSTSSPAMPSTLGNELLLRKLFTFIS